MHGFKRICFFCLVTFLLPSILIILPLYLRHQRYADVHYSVAESDILEIRDGISSIFCERHSLRMNTTFNAFQLNHQPSIAENRKHIRLRKSMLLPDDTLEYWGFYLLKGATVNLRVCSRYDGSRILVVKGDKDLKTCGLLEHNKNKYGPSYAKEFGQVIVTFETDAEIIVNETTQTVKKLITSDEDDGLGMTFEVPKKVKNLDVDNDAAEQFDKDDDEEFLSTTTTSSAQLTNNRSGKRKKTSDKTKEEDDDDDDDDDDEDDIEMLKKEAEEFIKSKRKSVLADAIKEMRNEQEKDGPQKQEFISQEHEFQLTPHERKLLSKYLRKLNRDKRHKKKKRKRRNILLERKVNHGGNALNFTGDASNSVSSFENNLLSCYDGQILLARSFPPSTLCRDVKYLESGSHMVTTHEVSSSGYYYYIFYSDNDNVENDINAIFDIHKPTFLYANISEPQKCYNATNCSFPIDFMTDEVVIVEVPTRDGIEHEGDDFTILISTCHPRMAVYVIFPIAVLFLILTCAFL